MKNILLKVFVVTVFIILFCPKVCGQEEITLTTYYPIAQGAYEIGMFGTYTNHITLCYDSGYHLIYGSGSDKIKISSSGDGTASGSPNDFVIDTSGNIGIGTDTPDSNCEISSEDATTLMVTDYNSTSDNCPIISLRRARNSASSVLCYGCSCG